MPDQQSKRRRSAKARLLLARGPELFVIPGTEKNWFWVSMLLWSICAVFLAVPDRTPRSGKESLGLLICLAFIMLALWARFLVKLKVCKKGILHCKFGLQGWIETWVPWSSIEKVDLSSTGGKGIHTSMLDLEWAGGKQRVSVHDERFFDLVELLKKQTKPSAFSPVVSSNMKDPMSADWRHPVAGGGFRPSIFIGIFLAIQAAALLYGGKMAIAPVLFVMFLTLIAGSLMGWSKPMRLVPKPRPPQGRHK